MDNLRSDHFAQSMGLGWGAEANAAPHPRAVSDHEAYMLEEVGALIIPQPSARISSFWIERVRAMVRSAAEGVHGPLKFLVFDFLASTDAGQASPRAMRQLTAEVANLILEAPIVSVAYARRFLAGPDVELAMACSMLVAHKHARFSFAADPFVSVATYALLAQRIGFVRAERLMEREDPLDAEQMRELLLVKEIMDSQGNALADFLARAKRRHNSSASIYRAQRIATPLVPDAFGETPH